MTNGIDGVDRLAQTLGYLVGLLGHAKGHDDEILLTPLEILVGMGGDRDELCSLVDDGHRTGVLARQTTDRMRAAGMCAIEPLPLPDPPALPPFELELLPAGLRDWVEDCARQAALPLEFVAVPAMIGLASLIGRNLLVRPDRESAWTTPPNLWGAIVARPGQMKSNALGAALSPISALVDDARAEHDATRDRAAAQRIVIDAQLAHAKRLKMPDVNEVESLLHEQSCCTVHERRYRTSDPTVEKLGELLIENPRGLLLYRDELSGWLRGLEKQGREGDREFYLEAWGGDSSYTVDRIGRGTLHIPALCMSVVGGIQPAKLEKIVGDISSGALPDDGLLQRLQLLVVVDEMPAWKRATTRPDRTARAVAVDVYRDVDARCRSRVDDPVIFDAHAQSIYDEWRDGLERRVRRGDLPTPFESHIAKYRGLVPSLALVLYVAEGGYPPDRVTPWCVQRAIRWASFLEAHARRVYGVDGMSPAARALAAKVAAGAVEDGTTVREIARAKWAALHTPELVAEAVDSLAKLGWLWVEVTKPVAGRPKRIIRLNPKKLW